MRRMFIAMRMEASGEYFARNNKLHHHAGTARNYSMSERSVEVTEEYRRTHPDVSIRARQQGWIREKIDSGHVLIVDLDSLPRVKFSDKGKAIGLGVDGIPSKLDEYENAERMIEIWAKRCAELRAELGMGAL